MNINYVISQPQTAGKSEVEQVGKYTYLGHKIKISKDQQTLRLTKHVNI